MSGNRCRCPLRVIGAAPRSARRPPTARPEPTSGPPAGRDAMAAITLTSVGMRARRRVCVLSLRSGSSIAGQAALTHALVAELLDPTLGATVCGGAQQVIARLGPSPLLDRDPAAVAALA